MPAPPGRDTTTLDRYVTAPDPNYRYSPIHTVPANDCTVHVLELTSQRWRDAAEVDRPLWKHWLTVVVPANATSRTALLLIAGGSNGNPPPPRVNPLLTAAAMVTGSVAAELRTVPNQPLTLSTC
jgi:PhoPQ-activated pathogenicity-related protein